MTITAEQSKGYLRDYVESITDKSKGKNMYVCPLCHSGEGAHHTGAFSITDEETSWKCFKCERGGDLMDLIGLYENIPDKAGQLKRVNELFGDGEYTHKYTHNHTHKTEKKEEPAEETDYTAFFLEAQKHITETIYHTERGISQETADRFGLGYVENWRHPKASDNVPTSPRLIIPTSKYSYLARDTSPIMNEERKLYSKQKVGKIHTFNKEALQTAQTPIFIVEGELDALSIIEVGGEAIALGTTSRVRAFLTELEQSRPAQPLVIALDNDEAGEEASIKLANGLQALKIPFYRYNPSGAENDANEALKKNREAFKEAVEKAKELQTEEAEAEQAEREAYKQTSTAHYLAQFFDGIYESINTPCVSTGFSELDNILDGGLYEGLYILGAISSLGKTTYITQIGDQIAQSGKDVLIISLEMGKAELIAKSLSRITLQKILKESGDTRNAKTVRGILAGHRWPSYSDTELALINEATKVYQTYAENIYILEGIGNIGVNEIREAVERHIKNTGNAPIVIVDYLQILAPYNDRGTDKQNTDKAVLELKRMSRDYKTAVLAISSFNRENYRAEASMQAFKESGAIEYGCDILLGLQLKGAGSKDFDEQKAKSQDPREVELKVLKNRNGKTGATIGYKYYPMFNYFDEVQSWEL